jgi:hypothetical protein
MAVQPEGGKAIEITVVGPCGTGIIAKDQAEFGGQGLALGKVKGHRVTLHGTCGAASIAVFATRNLRKFAPSVSDIASIA